MNLAQDIPLSVRDITVDWLNTVLPDDFATVIDLRWENLGQGVGFLGEVSRVHLRYAEGEFGPPTIIAKFPSPAPENVALCQAMGFYDREISFYRHGAESMPVKTARCLHGAIAPGDVPFVLLLDEVRDITVVDQLVGASLDQSRAAFSVLAKMHAHFWESDQLASFRWLPSMNNDMYKGSAELAARRIGGFRAHWEGQLHGPTLDAVEAFIPRYTRFLDWAVEQGALTLAHTDSRVENYLFGAAGEVTMIDFQFVTRFWGAWDVACWLGGSLTVDDRRKHEQELVEHYHSELLAHGVTDYPIGRCWRDIRASIAVQAFSQVVISDLDGANQRGGALLSEMVQRCFTAAVDYDMVGLLDTREF